MKKLLLLLSILLTGCSKQYAPNNGNHTKWAKIAQSSADSAIIRKPVEKGYGLTFGGSSGKTALIGILYRRNRLMYELGYTHQFNGQLGTAKGDRLPNYGKYVTGRDTYYVAPILGVGYWVTNRLAVSADFAFGFEKSYTNYSDKRFKAGGYHMINGSAGINGYGGKLYYLVGNYFTLSGGYNTLYGGHLSLGFSNFFK